MKIKINKHVISIKVSGGYHHLALRGKSARKTGGFFSDIPKVQRDITLQCFEEVKKKTGGFF